MPHYHTLGTIPHKRHTQFRKPDGKLYAEELFSTEGFSNDYSLMYHCHPPTEIISTDDPYDVLPVIAEEKMLKHRSFEGFRVHPMADFLASRKTILVNNDCHIILAAPERGTNNYFYKNAIIALERSFAIMPINYSGMALANLYIAGKNPRVLEICDIILSYDSAKIQTEPVFMKGVYYTDIKQYDSAMMQFDECIRRDWKMTDAYIEKGIIMYERKEYDEALKIFNMTVTVSNTDADGYYWLGRCYEATGKIDDAIANYERAVALDRTFTEARTALKRLNS